MVAIKQDKFAKSLLIWFKDNGRKDLPWQVNRTPYRVWVSEIMLQQTQVATVIPYFKRFMQSFPDIASLAKADLDNVLQHWTGLGYYARARNLHKAAINIHEQYSDQFPNDLQALVELPGIGRSTAGAILSIAFKKREPILDGNVKRVLTRYHEIEGWPGNKQVENKLWQLAETHTPLEKVDDYTQAIMDLGATICTRSKPDCDECPINTSCLANANQTQAIYPASKPRKQLPVKETYFVMLENEAGQLMLEKRPPAGIWGSLWCFPEASHKDEVKQFVNGKIVRQQLLDEFKHTFSHFHLKIKPVLIQVKTMNVSVQDDTKQWFNYGELIQTKGLPKPVVLLLDKFNEVKGE